MAGRFFGRLGGTGERRGGAAPARARPLTFYLVVFAAALAVPLTVMIAYVTAEYVAAERSRLRGLAQKAIQHIVASVDQELAGKIALLEALATSPALKSGEFEVFDQQVRDLRIQQGVVFTLRDETGRQLVNTGLKWGEPLPRGASPGVDTIVTRSRKPYISDLYFGAFTKVPKIEIAAPVILDGVVRYVLGAHVPATNFTAHLVRDTPEGPFTTALADRRGRIVTRSRLHEKFVGTWMPGYDDADGQIGAMLATNPEGVRVFRQYQRSELTGWLVALGVQEAAMDAPLRRSLQLIAVLGLILACIGGGIAMMVSRRMTGAIHGLGSIAGKLPGRGSVEGPATGRAEADRIGAALAAASTRLHAQSTALEQARDDLEHKVEERTRELADKTVLLEATLENMDQGLIMIDDTGHVPVYNRRALELLELPRDLLASRPHFHDVTRFQFGTGEFADVDEAFRQWVAAGGFERRHHAYERRRPNGTVLEIRTVPLESGGAVRTYTDVTERHRAIERIEHMAHHDALTGLANRVLFLRDVEQAIARLQRRGEPFSVLLLDLDRFKAVNDSRGHNVGDDLIRAVAERFAGCVRTVDTVARFGGDEFAVLQTLSPDDDPAAAAGALADRLLEAVRRPYDLDGHQVAIGVSIGIAMAPKDGDDANQLIKNADLALYRAKADGRDTFRFFEPTMDRDARIRHALEIDLRQAIARGEFVTHYQTVVDATRHAAQGVEALIRWQHPRIGLLGPDKFIPLAEETGLIVPLGAWVLRQACADAAGWPADVKIAVNLSPGQFRDGNLVALVTTVLAETGLAPERLELEITETLLLQHDRDNLAVLHRLRDLGVGIVLDDFGTGYSSLSYLQAFPFDKIKIDRRFVAEVTSRQDSAAIVCAVTGLARSLDIETTAEGVETAQQATLLQAAGCTYLQGYLFGRPKPAAEVDFGTGATGERPRREA